MKKGKLTLIGEMYNVYMPSMLLQFLLLRHRGSLKDFRKKICMTDRLLLALEKDNK